MQAGYPAISSTLLTGQFFTWIIVAGEAWESIRGSDLAERVKLGWLLKAVAIIFVLSILHAKY